MTIRKQLVCYMIFLVHAQGYGVPTLQDFDQLHDAKLPKYNWSHDAFKLNGETYRFNAEKMAADNSEPIMYTYQYATRDLWGHESTVKLINVRTAWGKNVSGKEFDSVVPQTEYTPAMSFMGNLVSTLCIPDRSLYDAAPQVFEDYKKERNSCMFEPGQPHYLSS